jgi:4a-hydroxytetrahydrobiopterin dehydratase
MGLHSGARTALSEILGFSVLAVSVLEVWRGPVMQKLSEAEVRTHLERVPGWALEGASIRREFSFRDFTDAIAFVVRLGFAAEADDHHPDILVSYKRVTLTYSTHSAGGVTEKDFAGAEEATRIAERLQPPAIAAD